MSVSLTHLLVAGGFQSPPPARVRRRHPEVVVARCASVVVNSVKSLQNDQRKIPLGFCPLVCQIFVISCHPCLDCYLVSPQRYHMPRINLLQFSFLLKDVVAPLKPPSFKSDRGRTREIFTLTLRLGAKYAAAGDEMEVTVGKQRERDKSVTRQVGNNSRKARSKTL